MKLNILLSCQSYACDIIKVFILAVKDNKQVYPQIRGMKEGGTATFTCHSSGDTRWYYEEKGTMPITKPIWISDRLVIHNLHQTHSGYYYCYGLYTDIVTHFLARSRMDVFGRLIHSF